MKVLVWKIKTFDQLSILELYGILKIRQEVFVVEQECFYLDADGYDEKAVHLWAENDNQIIAYCRIFKPGIKYNEASIGRVLTHETSRKSGLGKKLMQNAIEIISNRFRTKSIRISAQDYLLKFYSELGFKDTGNHYLEDDIPHTEMVKMQKFQYLKN